MFEWDVSPKDLKCTTQESKDGNCVLLKDCKKLFPELKNVESFKENFCGIKKNDNPNNILIEKNKLLSSPEDDQENGAEEEYNKQENNLTKPFILPDELKPELSWLENYINSDGSLNFVVNYYTLNNAGVCCP